MTDDADVLDSDPTSEPDQDDPEGRLARFWAMTQGYARVGDLDVYLGPSWSHVIIPPAYALDEDPQAADAALERVLRGEKKIMVGPARPFVDGEAPLPRVGDLAILLDGEGQPRALIRDLRVDVIALTAVTEALAAADDGSTLPEWLAAHREAWCAADASPDVVVERFKRLYP